MSSLTVDELDIKPFKGLNMFFPSYSFSLIVAPSNSGKTILMKILSGLIFTESKVRVNRTYIENIKSEELNKKVQVLLDISSFVFQKETVSLELSSLLDELGYDKTRQNKLMKEIISTFSLQDIIKKDPNQLNYYLKLKLLLARIFLINPEIVLLDDITKDLLKEERKEIMKILRQYNNTGTTIIMSSSDFEDAIFLPNSRIYVLYHGDLLLSGSLQDIAKEDSLISKVGLKLPFMADLSVKLMYYGILDHIELDKEKLVNILWK